MDSAQPKGTFVIEDLDTLKVLADPLRQQILEILVYDSLTVKQVGDRLGLAASKLYYHFKLLENQELIHVVDTRMVANILEKYFRAVAESYTIDESLFSFQTDSGKDNIRTLVVSLLNTTRDDILRTFQARTFALEQGAPENPREMVISKELARLPQARADEFRDRVKTLLEEFREADVEPGDDESDRESHALLIAYYPNIYFPEAKDESA